MDEDGGRIAENTVPGCGADGLAGYFVARAYNLVRMANLRRMRGLGSFKRCDPLGGSTPGRV